MDIKDLGALLDYHYWARDRILDAAAALTAEEFTRDLGSSFKSVRDTLVHVYSAEWVWHQRWLGASPTAAVAPDAFGDVASLRRSWSEQEAGVRALLEEMGAEGIHRLFTYTLLNGQPGASLFWQMLQHVVNHASYHRGQVTTMLRQLGAAPARSMDLIGYYREQGAAA